MEMGKLQWRFLFWLAFTPILLFVTAFCVIFLLELTARTIETWSSISTEEAGIMAILFGALLLCMISFVSCGMGYLNDWPEDDE